MNGILVWLALIIPSIFWGIFCAYFIRTKYSHILSALVPWCILLVAILYTEFFMPYSGGGASMWPIAQFVGGSVAAILGYQSYKLALRYAKH